MLCPDADGDARSACKFNKDRHMTPHQRFGFNDPPRISEQLREVIEIDRDIWMVRPEAFFIDNERTPLAKFGLVRPGG